MYVDAHGGEKDVSAAPFNLHVTVQSPQYSDLLAAFSSSELDKSMLINVSLSKLQLIFALPEWTFLMRVSGLNLSYTDGQLENFRFE